MSPTLFEQGVEVMVFGMGTVIAFLTLLVLAMGLMHRLLDRLYPEQAGTSPPDSLPAAPEQAVLVAVITAALHRHRHRQATSSRPKGEEKASHG